MNKAYTIAVVSTATVLLISVGILSVWWKYNSKDGKKKHRKGDKKNAVVKHETNQDVGSKDKNPAEGSTDRRRESRNAIPAQTIFYPHLVEGFAPSSTQNELAKHLESVFLKAYWDAFRADLKRGEYKCVVSILSEVRDTLVSLAPHNKQLYKELHENLDMELFSQVLNSKGFDSEYIASIVTYIMSKIQQLQAPVYDEITKKWMVEMIPKIKASHSLDEICEILPDIFSYIFKRINIIQAEIAKFHAHVHKARNDVDEIAYHRRIFQESLERGDITSKVTCQWLQDGLDRYGIIKETMNSESLVSARTALVEKLVFDTILKYAVTLDFHAEIGMPPDYPETLLFQIKLVLGASKRIAMIIEVATEFLLLRQFFHKEKIPYQSQCELTDLKLQLFHAFSQDRVAGIQFETADGMQQAQLPLYQPASLNIVAVRVTHLTKSIFDKYGMLFNEQHIETLEKMVKSRMDKMDPVFIIVQKRIISVLNDSSNIKQDLEKSGLSDFAVDIEKIIQDIQNMIKTNLQVHQSFYMNLFNKLLESK